jgi:mannose/cellobiose epimerase-like protein (N-acyl-D-glucosamine 2-epimerase family)
MNQTETEADLTEVEIFDYARRLFEARGAKAIAETAQKAATLEQQGDDAQARTWRQIESAMRSMRGPVAS